MLGVSAGTATASFRDLESHGFIRMAEESDWLNGKAREWRLTWMTSNSREPTNEWLQWVKLDSAFSERHGQTPNRSVRDTVKKKTPKLRNSETKNQQLRAVYNA